MTNNMVWNVYYHNINEDKIVAFNVLSHASFKHYTEKFLKECHTKEEFAIELHNELQYYFWCRAEYEVVIGPWVGGRIDGIKVDIYQQVMLNWEIFVDYVWSFKEVVEED